MKFSKSVVGANTSLAILTTIVFLLSVVSVRIESQAQELSKNRKVKTLNISTIVDGSGRFIFDDRGVRYEHKHWGEPTQVVINDVKWEVLANGFSLKKIGIDAKELKSAKIVKREARDVIALEHTENGFDLYASDSPPGAEPYSVTIEMHASE